MTVEIPAMPNAHSHAFQRDLRGIGERTGRPDDDFWSWREAMYALARRLDPESMRDVALRTYREMAAAGYGAVGEFHYVHHRPDGTPYDEPNEMAVALAETARQVGLRIVLLPAAYHRGGEPRFREPSVDAFLTRVDALRATGASSTTRSARPPASIEPRSSSPSTHAAFSVQAASASRALQP